MNESAVVVGVFEAAPQAHAVVQAVRRLGLGIDVVAPGEELDATGLLSRTSSLSDQHDLSSVLVSMGVPDGEARFYAHEADDGRTLLVVSANGRSDEVRKLVLEHGGYDVRSRGSELARASGAGVPGGTGAAPMDLTRNWVDVRSRYEMLWGQHY